MHDLANQLQSIVNSTRKVFVLFSDEYASRRPSPEKWTKKEILGHLIDSASNNHQRFVRGQLTPELRFPEYEQDTWVDLQQYRFASWETLVQLWTYFNTHLVHVITLIPVSSYDNRIIIGDNEPVTLEFIVSDYVRHTLQHVAQLLR